MLTLWIFLIFLCFSNCQEVPKEFVRRDENYYLAESNGEIPDSLKEYVELNRKGLFITGSSENDTSVLITTTAKDDAKWTFCRDDSLQCANKEQEFSVCYHDGNRVEEIHDIDEECNGPRMCKIKVKLSKQENLIFNRAWHGGHPVTPPHLCLFIHLYVLSDDSGQMSMMSNISELRGSSADACKLQNIRLPRDSDYFQTEIVVRQGKNNDGCNIKMSPNSFGVKNRVPVLTGPPCTSNRQKQNSIAEKEMPKMLEPQHSEKKKDGAIEKICLKDVKPQVAVTSAAPTAPATSGATTIETKKLQVHSTKTVGANVSAIPSVSSTQASLSCDKTPPKDEAEMTPDELEYLAFSTPDIGKRYRIFRTAVKLAEKIAESHGFWINEHDPTVPGDEEDWLKNHADNLTKICIEYHGVPVPDIGATHNEHLKYIDRHSIRNIYIVALYAEVEEPTRMFFLSSVIEKFRDVIKQIPTNELSKGKHPLSLLLRVYQEHPEVFGLRPPPKNKNNNNEKPNTTNKK